MRGVGRGICTRPDVFLSADGTRAAVFNDLPEQAHSRGICTVASSRIMVDQQFPLKLQFFVNPTGHTSFEIVDRSKVIWIRRSLLGFLSVVGRVIFHCVSNVVLKILVRLSALKTPDLSRMPDCTGDSDIQSRTLIFDVDV